MCEREKRYNAIRLYDDPVCCINTNENGWCENDEAMLGTCYDNLCLWPTEAHTPWYSLRYQKSPCEDGLTIKTGKDYDYNQLLLKAGCKPNDTYWCCGDAFPQVHKVVVPKKTVEKSDEKVTGALLVLDSTKWKAMQMGYFRNLEFEQRAFKSEKARCAAGGDSIRIIDTKYGSYFADTRHFKPGFRAFYMIEDGVIPLVTWC